MIKKYLTITFTENDSFLKTYLTGCKGSLEKTKRKLDAYYTYRSHSALFDSRDPLDSGYVKIRELVYFTPFRIMTKGRSSLFVYCRVRDADQEEFDFQYYLRLFLNVSELWLREVGYSAQVYLLGDFERTTVQHHIIKVKPLLLKDFIYYLLEVLPIRFCKVVFINAPPFIATFMNHAVVPFLTKKIKERLLITENGIEEVIEDFDKATLPSDYGGHFNVGEVDKNWRDEELKRRQWYLNELSEQCDESRRIVLEDPTNPYFGVPGSLKKLVVD
uniref:CRAL-TRIO domain-containing protein n=1 Tax=Rhodnius prolixus TaxID=13249 RepID=T1I2G3_RHOPR